MPPSAVDKVVSPGACLLVAESRSHFPTRSLVRSHVVSFLLTVTLSLWRRQQRSVTPPSSPLAPRLSLLLRRRGTCGPRPSSHGSLSAPRKCKQRRRLRCTSARRRSPSHSQWSPPRGSAQP